MPTLMYGKGLQPAMATNVMLLHSLQPLQRHNSDCDTSQLRTPGDARVNEQIVIYESL